MTRLIPCCPFDGAVLDRKRDMDGYTMLVCPLCDARFRADAWVNGSGILEEPTS